MRLVIEISEAEYKMVKEGVSSISMMRKVIRNGVRIPDDKADTIICGATEDEATKSFIKDVEAVKDFLPTDGPVCEHWDGHVCTGFHESICKYQDYNLYDFFEGKPCSIKCRLYREKKGLESDEHNDLSN